MSSLLNIGTRSLAAAQGQLTTISHNIANANTTGMKSSRAEFADVVASSLGSAGGAQAGIGVGIAAIAQQFTQGNITATSNPMDLAISGGGFERIITVNGKETKEALSW